MSLARFDWADNSSGMHPVANQPIPMGDQKNPNGIRLTFAGIGNIVVRVFGASEHLNFPIRRGILGMNTLDPIVTVQPWERGMVMVLHSDGLSTHWSWSSYPNLASASAEVASQQLLHHLAKNTDDATVVVVRSAQ